MSILRLYNICLTSLLKRSFINPADVDELPLSCLYDILPYLSVKSLENLDSIYQKRNISTNGIWRRHFELIWSLSREDKNDYESITDVPYKRLYFEYLFHDTQILQLEIYTNIVQINKTKSILRLALIEHLKYNLTRDSIMYCSKKRLTLENRRLMVIWNTQWNKYIKRFIFVPNICNLSKLDPSIIECLTQNVTDIVLSGYPTDNDYHGMKLILDILTHGHIKSLILKFPTYCLMNILSPILIYPRSYSLSYFSFQNNSDVNKTKLFKENLISSNHKRNICLRVKIDLIEENNIILDRILSTNHNLIEQQEENSSVDTTHATRSNSINMSHQSFDFVSISPMITQSQIQSENSLPTIESSHISSLIDNRRSIIEPYERLVPYLNRSPIIQNSVNQHLTVSESSIPNNFIREPMSFSDSNLFRRHLSSMENESVLKRKNDDEIDGKNNAFMFNLTSQNQTGSITNLSIYYISSFETIEMLAIALLGMNQIRHLTLVNFSLYSSQLETSLITLCNRSQLETLHLTSIVLLHGAIGFILNLFREQTIKSQTSNVHLKSLKLDTIKIYSSLLDNIHLSDIEQTQFHQSSLLEQFIWHERHMQYIHLRLLYKLLPNNMLKLHRLELYSIIECIIFDQYLWCQTILRRISDVRLRNFRIRPINLSRIFHSFNIEYNLTVFHFERAGLSWNANIQQTNIIQDAFTYLILHSKYLFEFSLAYNNLNHYFIQWLCQILLLKNDSIETNNTSWWPIKILNLTFNLISSQSIRTLIETLEQYKNHWKISCSPIRRIDILGNALEIREIPNLKQRLHTLGCDLISYISVYFISTLPSNQRKQFQKETQN